MEKNISTAAEQTKTAEVKKNPKIIELARPYKFDDKEYTEIDLSGLDGLTIKDAVLIIKKLYNEGELAAMITPETATAYTDALAAAATKLPIEFFQLLPIGASKKVRQTVQASLRSATAEDGDDKDDHSHVMKFGKPYTYKGETYTSVDRSGVATMTGMNVRQAIIDNSRKTYAIKYTPKAAKPVKTRQAPTKKKTPEKKVTSSSRRKLPGE